MNPTSLPIRIINPTAPDGKYIPTEYAKIRQYVKRLWDEQGEDVDLIYHLGMADGWNHYTIERRAYGEGFSSECMINRSSYNLQVSCSDAQMSQGGGSRG